MNHLPASASCLSDERERERLSEREGGRQGQEIWLIWISQTPRLLTEKSPLDFSRGFSVHKWGSHLFPTFCLRGSFTAPTSIGFLRKGLEPQIATVWFAKMNEKSKSNLLSTGVCWAERVWLFSLSEGCGFKSSSLKYWTWEMIGNKTWEQDFVSSLGREC